MHVLWHDDIAYHHESIADARLLQRFFKGVSRLSSAEIRLPVMTTKGQKVEVAGLLVSNQTARHGGGYIHSVHSPDPWFPTSPKPGDVGHPFSC